MFENAEGYSKEVDMWVIEVLFKSLCSSCFTFAREQQILLVDLHCFSVVLCYESQLVVDKLIKHWFQASAAMLMKSAVFWSITRHRVVIVYRHFGTTYRSHHHGSKFRVVFFPTRTLDLWRWDRYVVPKRRLTITTRCRVIPQKTADLIKHYFSHSKSILLVLVFLCNFIARYHVSSGLYVHP
jgi:hypothetical protein